jgi:hypothetical protein
MTDTETFLECGGWPPLLRFKPPSQSVAEAKNENENENENERTPTPASPATPQYSSDPSN